MKQKLFVVLTILVVLAGLAPDSRASAQTTNPVIQLTQGGTLLVTVFSLGGGCSGTVGLQNPAAFQQPLVTDYRDKGGAQARVEGLSAGAQLEFYLHPGENAIAPYDWCKTVKGINAVSTNPERAKITELGPNAWRIDWEDLPPTHPNWDNDYNDLVLVVRLLTAVADYKQDDSRWAANPYASLSGATIGGLGAGVTAAADILAAQGGLTDSSSTTNGPVAALNTCLNSSRVQGYYNGMVRWNKLGWCSDATTMAQPFLVDWEGKLAIGDAQGTTLQDLMDAANTDLALGQPVIFEVAHPTVANSVHYVVASEPVSATFKINDPWCGDGDPSNGCPGSKTLLSDFANVVGVLRFTPASGQPLPVLVLNAPANVNFVVTDGQGRRTGFDGTTRYAEIPDSNYYRQNPLATQPTSPPMTSATNELYLFNPSGSRLTVTVYGASGSGAQIRAEYAYFPLHTASASAAIGEIGGASEDHILFIQGNNVVWDTVYLYLPAVH